MGLDDLFKSVSDFIKSLIPGDALKTISDPHKRESQSLRVILKIRNIGAFPAEISLGAGTFLFASHLNDLAPLGGHFKTAIVKTEHTRCFLPLAHNPPPSAV
jgi:hypothetical protein